MDMEAGIIRVPVASSFYLHGQPIFASLNTLQIQEACMKSGLSAGICSDTFK
jgi:hypothetical protein